MRYYFFGDIHGNSEALEVCLQQAKRVKADKLFCLGDIIGWLPWGDETLKTIINFRIESVAGNHELLVSGTLTDNPEQIDRMQATAYTAGLLANKPDFLTFIEKLPLTIEESDFLVLHHNPFTLPKQNEKISIEHFSYFDESILDHYKSDWPNHPYRLIFSGHDHVPMLFELTSKGSVRKHPLPVLEERYEIKLNPSSKYWIKAGAVGGPYRDSIPSACSLLYDEENETLIFFRLEYDKEKIFRRLRNHRFFRNISTIQKYLRVLKQ